MPIQEQNIVFVESQVMDDVPEGGGAATGRVIRRRFGGSTDQIIGISAFDTWFAKYTRWPATGSIPRQSARTAVMALAKTSIAFPAIRAAKRTRGAGICMTNL